jgi:hypothetical protein
MSGALKRESKKGVTQEDGRRRREATTVALRKEKRDEGVSKRRMVASAASEAGTAASAGAGMLPAELSLDNLPSYCEGEHWRQACGAGTVAAGAGVAHGWPVVRASFAWEVGVRAVARERCGVAARVALRA